MAQKHLNVNIIACVDENNAIGFENELLFKIPEDLKRFRELTFGQPVVMGRNTWDSIPSKFRPLPFRKNIVVTSRHPDLFPKNVTVISDPDDVLKHCDDTVWIIGGQQLYRHFIPYASAIFLTKVEKSAAKADAFFPEFDPSLFDISASPLRFQDDIAYSYHTYRRKP